MEGSIFQIRSVAGVTLFYQKLSCHYGHSSKHIDSVAHIQNEAVIILQKLRTRMGAFSFDVLSTWYTVKTFGLLQPYFCHLSCMPVVYMTCYKLQKMLPI